MNKTFINYLKEVDKNEVLYVGTKNGTSWIIIEPVSTILENLDRLEEIVHGRVVKQNSNAQNLLLDIPCQIAQVQHRLLKDEFENPKDKRKTESKLYELEKNFANAFFMRKQTRERLDKWIKIADREVIDTYIHDGNDVPGTCIILEGSDNGTLWYKGEKKVL